MELLGIPQLEAVPGIDFGGGTGSGMFNIAE